uniref:Protein-arginine deiminase type-2-like n=1 Tax=Petromyzon marinus TaxID=7757 RepID=A0AAJ7TZI2_PETMA|nr:protein-arginine deiminase type-2-like [Petromyzon marinus]
MATTRTIHLQLDKVQEEVFVLGTELVMDIYQLAPPGAVTFSVSASADVTCWVNMPTGVAQPEPHGRVAVGTQVHAQVLTPSQELGDKKLSITFYGKNADQALAKAQLSLTAIGLSLDVDADRDGIVEHSNPKKGSWEWGPQGHGAVLLVNCDQESEGGAADNYDHILQGESDLKDMAPMVVRTRGPAVLPHGFCLQLYSPDWKHVGVFHMQDLSRAGEVNQSLGPGRPSYSFQYPGRGGEVNLFVEGLSFPDADFNGFVHFHLSLLQVILPDTVSTPIFTDSVVFRVAPWIMTPNTQPALQVIMCKVGNNTAFVKEMRKVAEKGKCKAIILDTYENDIWMQDQMEFGYCESPNRVLPVVFDSPRNRELKDIPLRIMGPDFGYVTRYAYKDAVSSLDSFGNLEVSPPVVVRGKKYPLGRIIIGSAFPTAEMGRNMVRTVREFLFAQQVQAPVELYSDWLTVGHVDEFMSFVPAPDRKGFRLLLASPDACLRLLKELHQQGHGQRRLFESRPEVLKSKGPAVIGEILVDEKFKMENTYVQRCIDWNRDVLKRELGLEEVDIIDLPVLFFLNKSKAEAYFPNMVNMVVLNKELAIPKPFGPIIDEQCALETSVCSLLEPLGLRCSYVDDLLSHHVKKGEVHCGSNTRRAHFAATHWWDVGPL